MTAMKDLSEARRIVEQQRGEIERLRQEVAMLRQEYAADTAEIAKLNAMIDEQRGEIERLKAELAEVKPHAARYQAIRRGAVYIEPHPDGQIYVATDRGVYCKTPEEVDATVDAATEQEQSE